MTDIVKELSRIQKELRAPKNQFNKFGGYKYRSCEDILEGLKKVQGDTAIILTDKVEQIGDRFYIKATATISTGEDCISVDAYSREPISQKGMSDPMLTGSASSYARKYALNGLFCIDDTKDADHESQSPKKTGYSNNRNQPNDPAEFMIRFGKEFYGKKLGDLTKEEAFSYCEKLEQFAEKQGKPLEGPAKLLVQATEALYGMGEQPK